MSILNPSRHHSKVREVHIVNCKQKIRSTDLIIQSTIDAGSTMDFAKPDNEDGVVNRLLNKGPMQTLMCFPSPLKKTMQKVNSPLLNECDPLV